MIKILLYPLKAFMLSLSQISVGLSFDDVLIPQMFLLFFSLFILENMSTFFTYITLSSVSFTVLFCLEKITRWTFFLS